MSQFASSGEALPLNYHACRGTYAYTPAHERTCACTHVHSLARSLARSLGHAYVHKNVYARSLACAHMRTQARTHARMHARTHAGLAAFVGTVDRDAQPREPPMERRLRPYPYHIGYLDIRLIDFYEYLPMPEAPPPTKASALARPQIRRLDHA